MTLGESLAANPIQGLIVVSIIVTIISTLAHKWLTDQERIKNVKVRQKEIQKELKGCKDTSLMGELNTELMKLTGLMFKLSMKPLIITIVPFWMLFIWLRSVLTPIMGFTWFWYYLGFSIVASLTLRKVFKVA